MITSSSKIKSKNDETFSQTARVHNLEYPITRLLSGWNCTSHHKTQICCIQINQKQYWIRRQIIS